MRTFELCARADGLQVNRRQLSLSYHADEETMRQHFQKIADSQFDPLELAKQIPERHLEKYDAFLSDELPDQRNVSRCLQIEEAAEIARQVIGI